MSPLIPAVNESQSSMLMPFSRRGKCLISLFNPRIADRIWHTGDSCHIIHADLEGESMLVRSIGCAVVAVILVCAFSFGEDGLTPLHRAVRADDFAKAEQLIHAGADAKAADRY